jgi:SAM-dependent methyltransferase
MFTQSAIYYDILYTGRRDYAGDGEFLHTLVQQHKRSAGRALLDVACGTGLHLRHLRERFDVAGLDLDPEMLKVARRNCPEVEFHQGDMLDFHLDALFDAIICMCSSIGYVRTEDRLTRAIRNLARHLAPGGVLIVEPWFGPANYFPGAPHAAFIDQPNLKIARMNVSEIVDGISILDFHYLVATPDGVRHFTERHELGLFTPEEYLAAFQACGLETIYDPKGFGRGLFIGINPR